MNGRDFLIDLVYKYKSDKPSNHINYFKNYDTRGI